MGHTGLENMLWAAGFVGHVALFAILIGRSRWRVFPVFTSMIAYQVVVTLVLFLTSRYGSHHAYFLWYWILALGDYVFQVALILEIARNVLRSTGTWVQDARRGFLFWSAAGTLFAAGLCLTISPPSIRGLDLWEMRATLFTSLLTCELFLSVSAAANRLGLRWRSQVMSLGQGLAAWAAVAVIGDVAHVATGWRKELLIFDETRMYVYLAVLLFWIVSFSRPEENLGSMSPEFEQYIFALHQRVRSDLKALSRAE